MTDQPSAIEYHCVNAQTVSVAGDWNDWCGSARGAFDPRIGAMQRIPGNRWRYSLAQVAPGRHEFKFVIDGHWESGANRVFQLDRRGRLIDPSGGVERVTALDPSTLEVRFSTLVKAARPVLDLDFHLEPGGIIAGRQLVPGHGATGDTVLLRCRQLDFTQPLVLVVGGLGDEPLRRPIHLDVLFKKAFISGVPLGVTVEGEPPVTICRLFAPRASTVILEVWDDPAMLHQRYQVMCWKDSDGVWEGRISGTCWGLFYTWRIDGPTGEGCAFDFSRHWPDPYGRAAVHHRGPTVFVEPGMTGHGFAGWTDQDFQPPSRDELIIYEASVRDLTADPSSLVEPHLRGKYLGLADTVGRGTGIDHLERLGVNVVELLPVHEFDDEPPGAYHWGYMTSLFFAPEASYATRSDGAQVPQFKALVDRLHSRGIAVVLDVVYNHTGAPDVFDGIDRQYYYRLDGNFTKLNFSGCGNDVHTENPMVRRLIIDSLEYWVREFHVDGFRFDLGELIDDETLRQIESRLTRIDPDLILISEPWSFRGNHKGRFRHTRWSMWNDDFRNRIKDLALGRIPARDAVPVLTGSTSLWTAHPLESVNYVESHDNYTLTDHLTTRPNHDGRDPTPLDLRRNRFCAALTLLAPGIPMLAQGQEMLRSKGGNGNSYNAGDAVNKVDYRLRDQHAAIFSFYRDLIALRRALPLRLIRQLDATGAAAAAATWTAADHDRAGALVFTAPDADERLLLLFNADPERPAHLTVPMAAGPWRRLLGDDRVWLPGTVSGKDMYLAARHRNPPPPVKFTLSPVSVELWWRPSSLGTPDL